MKVQKTMNMTPSPSQQSILTRLQDFISSDGGGIFILKGYAGTGKTTMIRFVVDYLRNQHYSYQLMAPTGRAAKVLRDKVGTGFTIHKTIYDFKDLQCIEGKLGDGSDSSFHYVFPVREKHLNDEDIRVAIVDEASMVSDNESHQEFYTFGTGRLLTDLLKYCVNFGIRKLIFVGDDAQLPPVSDNSSRALDSDYFASLGCSVEVAEMTEVVRQSSESGILSAASYMRTMLKRPRKERSQFELQTNGTDMIEISRDDIFDKYLELCPSPQVGNAVIVSFSNAQCYRNNAIIRERMYGENGGVRVGDVLLINNNNYNTFGREVFNGDMAQVVAVGGVELVKIPVIRNGESKEVELKFQHLSLQFPDDGRIINCVINHTLLFNESADLTVWEQQALYIYFKIRNSKLKEGSEEYKDALQHDMYFNMLKAKFGYAITCHKAQGGEWSKVFVDYTSRIGTSDDMIRWCYTATTRAKEQLYLINPPRVSPFTKFKVSPIIKATNCPPDFFAGIDVESSFHKEGGAPVPASVKYKINSIVEEVKESPFALIGIESFPYKERLKFQYGTEVLKVDLLYKASGLCNPLPENGDGPVFQLHKLVNRANNVPGHIVYYNPSNSVLKDLYQRVCSLTEEYGIIIISIQEMPQQYQVVYNLVTDARFAVIQFYINDKGEVSTAIPRSELGVEDSKLLCLLQNLA